VLYIRELTYRIQDQRSLANSLRLIKELRKRVSDRESEERDRTGLISQDKLILSKTPRNPRLPDLFIRPSIPYTSVYFYYLLMFVDPMRH
jgi:nucleosome binding factor SPN SPT16 subunit